MSNKINKVEPFDLNRAINDFQAGSLEMMVAKPDFGAAHQPHIDLNVRQPGAETVKYRIYDTPGASNLLDQCGPNGLGLFK